MNTALSKKGFLPAAISAIALQSTSILALGLEEIVVTAQKREQSANDVGMAIQALSGDAMKDLGVADTTDLAAVVPGLTFSDTGYGTPIYTLRGVGFIDNAVQAASTVGVYVDEVAIPFPLMTKGALLDIERVEVMKGPQGTLYGRNSTGGAINFIANKPGDLFEASITAGYGKFDIAELSGFVSTPLSDTVGLRVAGKTTQSSEGWQESVTTGARLGEQDKTAVRAILQLTPSDDLDISVSASYWEDNSDTQAPVMTGTSYKVPVSSPDFATYGAWIASGAAPYSGDDITKADWTQNAFYDFKQDLESTNISISVEYALSDALTLTSLTSYSELSDDSLYPRDGVPGVPDALIPAALASNLPQHQPGDNQANVNYQNHADVEAFSQELRLSGEGENMTWISGVYFSTDEVTNGRNVYSEFTTNTDIALHPAAPITVNMDDLVETTEQASDMWAVFTHAEWQLTEDLRLTTGLRYTEDNKDFKGCLAQGSPDAGNGFGLGIVVGGGTAPGECASADAVTGLPAYSPKELNEDSVSGRLGLDYVLSNDTMIYASVSRGFKSGSFPTLSTVTNTSFAPATQEQLDALEIGFKSTLVDGTLQLNGAAFYYEYTDKQVLGNIWDPTYQVLSKLVNVPESEVLGAELELQWQAADGLYVGAGVTYIDSEAIEFTDLDPNATSAADVIDLAGYSFPLSPEWTANWIVNYEMDISDSLVAAVGIDGSYASETTAAWTIDPLFALDSYHLTNLRASVGAADDTWKIMAWVRNANNTHYATSVDKSVDFITQFNGMPRTYGLEFTYNWM